MKFYFDGKEMKHGDMCVPVSDSGFSKLQYIEINADGIVTSRNLISSEPYVIKESEFSELRNSKHLKHKNLKLVIRKKEWEAVFKRLENKIKTLDLDMCYEIPQGCVDIWVKD